MLRTLTVALACLLLAAACGGSGSESAGSSGSIDWNQKPSSKPVELSFWYSFAAGPNQDAVNALVGRFNAEHRGQMHVTATYTGAYDDTFAKYKAAIQSNRLPSIVQIYDIGTRFMIDSGTVQPVQTFIDHDRYDTSSLWPNITGYYRVGDRLWSMPWNTSMPVLYYNRDAFARAGLDPNRPPQTFQEIEQDAKTLQQKGAAQYGFNAAIYGWYLEQWAARADVPYCNNGNGRSRLATSTLINQRPEEQTLDWWTRGVREGWGLNTGRNTTDADKAFQSGRVAMTVESTGSLSSILKASSFSVGTGFYPRDASWRADRGGNIIGGASVWVVGKKPSAEQVASWQFARFLAQPDSQAYWHTHTGYFPINRKALDVSDDQAWLRQYPQFSTAITQLQQTRLDNADQGCLLGVMPQARQTAEDAIEQALTGRASPQGALDAAVANVRPAIASYNQSVRQ